MGAGSGQGYESQRKAAAINYLLGQIGLSNGEESEWWNHRSYSELGDRTPTQAWLAGDEEDVRKLIDHWYEESQEAVDRHLGDPEFMMAIRHKMQTLHARYSRAS